MSSSNSAPLQAQLKSIDAANAAAFSSLGLSPAEIQTYSDQFSVDKVNPYPVPKVGTIAPSFTLVDNKGKQVSLKDVVVSGRHAILVWYRGEWCPYCAATLKAHNARLDEYQQLGADFYAITPTLPSVTPVTVEKFGLQFPVLSDVGNKQAKAYGTLNQLNEDLSKLYLKLGVPFETIYGDTSYQLPHPGTFIVEGKTGKLAFAQVEMDYRKRVEPEQLIEELRKLQ